VHALPHVATELLLSQSLPHWWLPASHEIPHVPPPHVACPAPPGTVHTTHAAPHAVASVSDAQTLPQLWKPTLHAKPHDVPSHVA
jgi:hypothetical protein